MRRLFYFAAVVWFSGMTVVAAQALARTAASQDPEGSPYYEKTYTFEWATEQAITVDCPAFQDPYPVQSFTLPPIVLPPGSVVRAGKVTDAGISFTDSYASAIYTTRLKPELLTAAQDEPTVDWVTTFDDPIGVSFLGGNSVDFPTMSLDNAGEPMYLTVSSLRPRVQFLCGVTQSGEPQSLTIASAHLRFEVTVGFTGEAVATYSPGDANCDGAVDIIDSLKVRRILAGLDTECSPVGS